MHGFRVQDDDEGEEEEEEEEEGTEEEERKCSADKAAMHPEPAAVMACLHCLSCTSPAAKTPGTLVVAPPGAVSMYLVVSFVHGCLYVCLSVRA